MRIFITPIKFYRSFTLKILTQLYFLFYFIYSKFTYTIRVYLIKVRFVCIFIRENLFT